MSGKSETADRLIASLKPDAKPDLPVMIRRYLGLDGKPGESIQVLAAEQGKSRRTIYRWMLSGLGDEQYEDLVTEALVSRVADADDELEAARESKDPVRVTAARENCRFSRMDLERRRPHLYGPKQEVKHSGGGPTLNIVLLGSPTGGAVGNGTQVLEHMPALPVAEEKLEQGDVHEEVERIEAG